MEKVVNNFNKTGSNNTPIQLVKVDIDNLSETTGKYNVQAVPTGENLIYYTHTWPYDHKLKGFFFLLIPTDFFRENNNKSMWLVNLLFIFSCGY